MPISKEEIAANKKLAQPYLREGKRLWRMQQQIRNEQLKIEREISAWRASLNKALNTDALDFSSHGCSVFPAGHVYSSHFYRGTGHRACVFCGMDDFDF